MEVFNATTWYILTVLLLYIIWFYKRSFAYWKERGLEYLEPVIPLGNAFRVISKKLTVGEVFAQFYLEIKERGLKHAGVFVCWKPIYIPVDPEIIKRILITDFEYFPNRGLYISEEKDPLSTHIFNAENSEWRNLRAKLPAAFTSAKMRKMFAIMEKLSKQFKENLDAYATNGTPFEIKSEISRFTADIIASCAHGIETNIMKKENEELLKQGRSFFDNQFHISKVLLVITIPRHILVKLNFRIMTREFEKYFSNLFQNIMKYRKEKEIKRGDLTDIFIRLNEKHDDERDFSGNKPIDPINDIEFVSHLTAFFCAGFETSSSTVTFALYELARNPEYQSKLRTEIKKILTKYDNNVTYDAVMEMKYLDNIVDETLRLYPVLPILPRQCAKDYKVPGTNVTIEKGTYAIISNMGIQRDPEYYPNPDKFIPERFSKENNAKRPFISHVPFGEGPRICVGKRFGILQTKIALVTMLRNYEILLDKKTSNSFTYARTELILRKAGNVWIKLKHLEV
ncbi:cytochrome P450 6a8-like isoform X2 [Anoplophora glabripennis]|uniref:cytochrome P450 6a8 isoform X1 n=1 Tax=Anoplophora glabripennis TaxID=217634 RepID=UPI000C75A0A5|nr:cytochrome P450 6a8 isoform X1 [Anoplophora glabripennis]XP_023312768.1 cytochrome P450 6a8 isoform X2 [Anoplophora glabripennis]XP_023312807.1 cytochrome P450 6a8-like isoform X1 [Anoplophora glabripennis]XP_023312808.1 cytochrome P450 6a8-like isoform X2 [Anoplophora glabripennis]